MAITQLLAVGTGAANSVDIVVPAGAPVTVMLKDADGSDDLPSGCAVNIMLKDDGGQYFRIGQLNSNDLEQRARMLTGPGTYRLSRTPGSASCGAFSA
jgi:hypothetical protein